MAESVPVRCPVCRREHSFTPPTFPCPCGVPLTLPVPPDATPVPLGHDTWEDGWVTARCPSCEREDEWPRPEFGCGCGAVLRLPVIPSTGRHASNAPAGGAPGSRPPSPDRLSSAVPRPAFQPVTIRTSRDAVAAAAQYLKWLGFRDVLQSDDRPSSGVDLRGTGVIAQVDPTTRPSPLRDIECLWLNGLAAEVSAVFFSLAGYARDARARADELQVPLFVMDLSGMPQPVNDAADDLIRMGA
jgi:hypothetical protein